MTPPPRDDRYLTTAEAAERLRQPESTLRYWRSSGTGPRWFKAGRRALYRESQIEDWVARRERQAAS